MKENSYLNGELDRLREEKLASEEKIKTMQFGFSEAMKRNLGPMMKKDLKQSRWTTFKNKIKMFLGKIGKIYG